MESSENRKRSDEKPLSRDDVAAPETPVPAPPDTPATIRELITHQPRGHTVLLDIAPAAIWKTVLTLFGLLIFFRVWKVWVLLLFAIILAAALNPLVKKLQRVVARTWAVVAILLGLLLVLTASLWALIPTVYSQTVNLISSAPQLTQKLQEILAKHHVHMNLEGQVSTISGRFMGAIPELLKTITYVGEGIAGFVVVIVLAIYMLIEGPKVSSALARLLPVERRMDAVEMVNAMSIQVGGYIRGQVIASILAGIFSLIVLYFNHVPNALALAALAAFLDILPLIGVLVATVAAALTALTAVGTKTAIIVLILYICYHQLESHVIIPQVYGNTLNLSLTLIVLSILIGAELLGLAGIMLALPIAAATPSLLEFIRKGQEENDVTLGSQRPGNGVHNSDTSAVPSRNGSP